MLTENTKLPKLIYLVRLRAKRSLQTLKKEWSLLSSGFAMRVISLHLPFSCACVLGTSLRLVRLIRISFAKFLWSVLWTCDFHFFQYTSYRYKQMYPSIPYECKLFVTSHWTNIFLLALYKIMLIMGTVIFKCFLFYWGQLKLLTISTNPSQ